MGPEVDELVAVCCRVVGFQKILHGGQEGVDLLWAILAMLFQDEFGRLKAMQCWSKPINFFEVSIAQPKAEDEFCEIVGKYDLVGILQARL